MFSTRSSAAFSDGIFSRHSACSKRTYSDRQNDLIAFLAIVQQCNVDYLPITWQPGLDDLGQGATGTISQSEVIKDLSFAFKRYNDKGNTDSRESDMDFLPLMSEVLILSQPPIQKHPHIVNLLGICWEIKLTTQKAVPVLVFEKASCDLQQFLNSDSGRNIPMEDRLKFCADIGSAMMTMHAYGVIHGDIKPQNVLVFNDATGSATVKVADFGYSTLTASEDLGSDTQGPQGGIWLPKSRPWNAPEHNFEEFTATAAKKADVYSFGMLCLWILFGSANPPLNGMDRMSGISFGAPGHLEPHTSLERLKDNDKVEYTACELIQSVSSLSDEHKSLLQEFFSMTVPSDPEKRTSDIRKLVELLHQARAGIQNFIPLMVPLGIAWGWLRESASWIAKTLTNTITPFKVAPKFLSNADFRIAENLADFVATDYRVRIQIKDSLEKRYLRDPKQSLTTHIAFQIAFCYLIGFGTKADSQESREWLEKSGKQLDDLRIEKNAVQPAHWRSRRMRDLDGFLSVVDIIHEYRTGGLNQLEEARIEYEREVGDMTREFGELHFIPLALNATFADLLDQLGQVEESKVLRMRIRNGIEQTKGISLPDTWTSMEKLSATYHDEGNWKEAEALHAQLMKEKMRVFGREHPATLTCMDRLALTYRNQGQWKEAEVLGIKVLEARQRVIGQDHEDTLTGMINLASTYSSQGRLKEAEGLEAQVMEMRKRVLGEKHPATLLAMSNLALTYTNQGRLKEAEVLFVQVLKTEKRVFDTDYPDKLTTMGNLAMTYTNQGRWKEAEELEVEVLETEKRVLGKDHQNTLASMNNLASTYQNQGRWKEAEELGVQVVEAFKRVLGKEHPDTLTSMSNLASTFSKQGLWKEAEKLQVQVLETEKRILGEEHPDNLTNMGNLALTYTNQGRWKEAEKLQVQVLEMEKRVLGKDHPDTLISMSNLAFTYMRQERLGEAEKLEVQAMETRKRVLGKEHPATLCGMGNLGLIFQKQKRWREAEELEVHVMEARKRVLGLEHPETLASIANLAHTYNHRGRTEEAKEMMMQLSALHSRRLGEDNRHAENLASSSR